ncbi:MAG: type III pantothenate kinase [Flavobacteriales bacterium]|nr:type III pantothenate kinase [Flavobacteriales bacterium]
MMNLVIDIGNTLVKLAVFEGDKLLETIVEKQLEESLIVSLYENHNIKKGIYASVRASNEDETLLKKYNFYPLSHLTPLPLAIKYKTPETLGIDRIAAVVGAKVKFKNTDLLVMDLGTCITYDFVNSKNEYLGGAIAPGFQMRFKALNHFTGKLPLVNFNVANLKLIGNTTETSIVSGVYNGMKNEVIGAINSYLSQYETLKIVVTGGDINLFDLEPKNRIFADEFLVLKGLNEILNYNAE